MRLISNVSQQMFQWLLVLANSFAFNNFCYSDFIFSLRNKKKMNLPDLLDDDAFIHFGAIHRQSSPPQYQVLHYGHFSVHQQLLLLLLLLMMLPLLLLLLLLLCRCVQCLAKHFGQGKIQLNIIQFNCNAQVRIGSNRLIVVIAIYTKENKQTHHGSEREPID